MIKTDHSGLKSTIESMPRYKNLRGNSRISAFETGDNFIKVQFTDGAVYLYDTDSAGTQNIEEMKRLANKGSGLNSFIDAHVRKKYAARLR